MQLFTCLSGECRIHCYSLIFCEGMCEFKKAGGRACEHVYIDCLRDLHGAGAGYTQCFGACSDAVAILPAPPLVPLAGVYTGVTSQLGKTVHSHSFQVMGAIATCTHVLMWLVVIVLTVIHAWTGRLFHAPCLSQSRPGGCSGGLPTSGAQDPAARAACKLEEQLAQCATQCQPSSRAASPEPAKAAHQADGACHAAAV